ncbi:Putative pre-rRNA-processing protein TSR2 [Septoria linicola]|uniref:Pre-rRNA-processing protein TSR2 n=1 Tax=Septoria linicola TaxID=215465 RepID=A0A9Q9AZH3_9PEZI|nr:putative pre-rRNA-processing protein TSR2 [Septoria linicola]USW55375.1 Putative pre-rRNA-processing protein TSR2 [Septoria linicola]
MASQAPSNGPTPVPQQVAVTVEELQTAFDYSIWYLLSLWQPLHIALQNGWGGPDSADKRDWFAGAVSDLLTTRPDTDQDDLEDFLLQIMGDEFECNVEDESEMVVAGDILKVRQRMMETRTLDAAKEVEARWKNRGAMKSDKIVVQEVNQDAEDEGEFEGFEDDDDMDEAPALVQSASKVPKEKTIPEVDDDGFTKVAGKKRTG